MKRFVAVLAAAAALAGPARAASRPDLRLMALPEEVRAGQSFELQWPGAPREVEELEIVLSLDDGRTWRVRVSPELEGSSRRYRWRVPDLPAERARLRIRAGDDRGHEWEGTPSEAFRIVGSGRANGAEAPLVERGWWFDREGPRAAPASDFADAAEPGIEPGSAAWPGAPLPAPPGLAAPARLPAPAAPPPVAAPLRGDANPARALRLIVVPLRN